MRCLRSKKGMKVPHRGLVPYVKGEHQVALFDLLKVFVGGGGAGARGARRAANMWDRRVALEPAMRWLASISCRGVRLRDRGLR
jgi:hypothetical protein